MENLLRRKPLVEIVAHRFSLPIIFFLLWFGVNQLVASPLKNEVRPLADKHQKINLAEFYSALESQDTIKLNSFLDILEHDSTSSARAYTGALLMKKSGLIKSAKEKLPMFKQGKIILENAIKKDNKNAEFHFLRLIIQENCPVFLKYQDNMKEDADAVKQMYKKLSPALKQAVMNYSKTSKALKASEFPTGGQ